ncbi:hypothetical protein VaNZ11_017160, partial [Volvox africanus]
VTFTNHFVTTPICCPSRVSLQRGQLSPNTNFTDVLGPHGGSAKFRALDLDREWLPTWLQKAGYTTLYTATLGTFFFRRRKYGMAKSILRPRITRRTTKVKLIVGLGSTLL